MNIHSRAPAAVLLVSVVLPVMVASATPASAHPFGPPATARISVAGSHVALTWLASPDDLVALGVAKGAFADPAPELTGEQKLQRSTVVRDYLISKITVSQGAGRAQGSWRRWWG